MEISDDTTRIEYRIAMPYDEYQIRFLDNKFVEWIDGEAVVFPLPTTRHQEVRGHLSSLIGYFVSVYRTGKVIIGPIEMKLSSTGNARTPDILYVAAENGGHIEEQRVNGAADLVIEIVDTETVSRDRAEKFYDYQTNGVREYWIIDPRPGLARADFWVLDSDGRFRPVPISTDGTYQSTVLPNFKLNVNDFYKGDLPGSLQALADMIGVEAIQHAIEREQ
jgi:Uma2 family endonuclease